MQQTITITSKLAGKRIDQIPVEGVSRSMLGKHGKFLLHGEAKKAKTKTKEGEAWTIVFDEESSACLDHIVPWDTPLDILAESDSWAILNKPIGISVHPSRSEKSDQTIVNALVHHFGKDLAEAEDIIDGKKILKPGLVHRLDKTTSGILLIAKTNEAYQYFQSHWGEVSKYYTALVEGQTPKKGKVEAGIVRDPVNRVKMMVSSSEKSKASLTTFETLAFEDEKSLLRVQIHTGRTHQIRVHLSSIGFPIVGDTLYGGEKSDRVYLHATKLVFPDPDKGGEIQEVECMVDWKESK